MINARLGEEITDGQASLPCTNNNDIHACTLNSKIDLWKSINLSNYIPEVLGEFFVFVALRPLSSLFLRLSRFNGKQAQKQSKRVDKRNRNCGSQSHDEQVITQTTRHTLQGEQVPVSEKIVSLFEEHGVIIRRGKESHLVEYGHKVWLNEVEGGLYEKCLYLSTAWINFGFPRPGHSTA